MQDHTENLLNRTDPAFVKLPTGSRPVPVWRTRFFWRGAGLRLAAGLSSGLVLGALARLAMRIVALAAGMQPAFSLEGTAGILVIFAVVGLVASGLLAGLERLGAGSSAGPALGLGLFVAAIPVLLRLASAETSAGGLVPLVLGLFGASFVAFGFVLRALTPQLGR